MVRTAARGLFLNVPELLKRIRSTYNPVVKTAEMDVIRPALSAELLVLDDLGSERPTEWVEETMNLIVNSRYNDKLPTIITTNYPDNPDDSDLNSLKVRVGFRMHSRLHEMCEFWHFEGPDYRLIEDVTAEKLAIQHRGSTSRRSLPVRSSSPARAQLKQSDPLHSLKNPGEARELRWPGGKAGRG
jgi:DNA replication protein DnaC